MSDSGLLNLLDSWARLVRAYRQKGIVPRAGSPDEARELLMAGSCLFCSRDGFVMVASHVVQVHGVTARELTWMTETPVVQGFTSPEVHARRSALATARRAESIEFASPPPLTKGRRLVVTPARRRANREKALALATDSRRLSALRAKRDSDPVYREKLRQAALRGSQVSAERNLTRHPCPNCGNEVVGTRRRTCSEACASARSSIGRFKPPAEALA